MRALRTPDERFAELPDFPFEPHYVEIPATPEEDGRSAGDGELRVHCYSCTASRHGGTCTDT